MTWRMELADGVEPCLDLEMVLALRVNLFLEHYLCFWQSLAKLVELLVLLSSDQCNTIFPVSSSWHRWGMPSSQ